tara:strand:- start:20017 stop:20220 length:204 start_codon:yes stop_codon:yes gene_type:complete
MTSPHANLSQIAAQAHAGIGMGSKKYVKGMKIIIEQLSVLHGRYPCDEGGKEQGENARIQAQKKMAR